MDYTPRYPQPFTLHEATLLDVPIITEGMCLTLRRSVQLYLTLSLEIARLQNSLHHLHKTQEGLQEAINECRDPDFVQAFEENSGVMYVNPLLQIAQLDSFVRAAEVLRRSGSAC